MMGHSLIKLMLVAALVSSDATCACGTPIQMAIEGSKVVAHFKVGDSHCRLMDDHIRCSRVSGGD
jgi:hypothetical protein